MANQYTKPREAHFRYLGNQIWERVDRYKVEARWQILSMPNDYRNLVYAFFDQVGGLMVEMTFPYEVPERMKGEVVCVPRAFWKEFPTE